MVVTPENICELCSLELDSMPAILFRSVCWKIVDGMSTADAVNDTARQQHMPRVAVYATMKKALQPVLNAMAAKPQEWRAMGLEPQTSTAGLAREIARQIRREDYGLEA